MFIFYDLIFFLVALMHLPLYLFKRKFHRGFLVRLGILPKSLALARPIWIHAVSVGEVMAVRGLVEELRKTYPGKKFVISTVTATGNRIAQGIVQSSDFLTYLPFDFSFLVARVLKRIDPCLFIIVETEIWPNLISALKKRQIPTISVNSRISDGSFAGYFFLRFFVRKILQKFRLFCVQTEQDKERLLRLGADRGKIEVTGNMKFDKPDLKKDYPNDKEKLRLSSTDLLLVAGSTHRGEEEIILGAYQDLLSDFASLRLLIAPRHPERTTEIEKLIKEYSFNPLRKIPSLQAGDRNLRNGFSSGEGPPDFSPGGSTSLRVSLINQRPTSDNSKPIFILDTVGELMDYYALADMVFVGGSLVKKGGHNILEPAILQKPILCGPYMFNFRDIFDLFLKEKAIIIVHNKEELKTAATALLNKPQQATFMIGAATKILRENQGATKRNAGLIARIIAET